MPSRPCKHNNRCMRGLSLAHSNEALKRCGEPRATPVLLSRELLPVYCTESYSRSIAQRATPCLCCAWAPVRRGRQTLTPTAEVRIVVLPERWARRLLDKPPSTVSHRVRVPAIVWKLPQCPLRAQTRISFSVPSVNSVAPPCHGGTAVDDCLPRRGHHHL